MINFKGQETDGSASGVIKFFKKPPDDKENKLRSTNLHTRPLLRLAAARHE